MAVLSHCPHIKLRPLVVPKWKCRCEFDNLLTNWKQRYFVNEKLDSSKTSKSWLFYGGVAWSSGQHRSLPLQGSRVHIPALPSFFAVVTATMLRWQPKQFNYGSGTPQSKKCGAWMKAGAAKTRWIDRQGKVEWNKRNNYLVRFEDD